MTALLALCIGLELGLGLDDGLFYSMRSTTAGRFVCRFKLRPKTCGGSRLITPLDDMAGAKTYIARYTYHIQVSG